MTHRNISFGLTLLVVALMALAPAAAQQQKQHGVARMITRSAKDPVVPVSGAQITLGNSTKTSDARGQFTLNVTKNKAGSYRLTAVSGPKGSDLILASPRLSDPFSLSSNNLVLAFTTDEAKQQYYKELYLKFYKKYNAERAKLKDLSLELKMKQLELEKTSAEYRRVSASLDSVQALLDTEFGEQQEENIAKNLGHLAEQLIVTDYQSLDANDAKIYELRCAGDWEALSEYLLELMDGDPDAYVQEGVDIKNAGLQVYARRLDNLKKLIESYTSQSLYSKAAHYYKTLIKADSTNWENYNGAGSLAAFNMGDYELAQNYFAAALKYADSDTARAAVYNNIGAAYSSAADYVHAEQYTQKALDLLLAQYGEQSADVAATYDKLGDIYAAQGNAPRADSCHQKASNITFSISRTYEQHFIVRMITRSANDPIRPISGVRLIVNGVVSSASNAGGNITLSVPIDENKSFTIDSVLVPNSKLELVLPNNGERLFISRNNIQLAFTTKEVQDGVNLSTYRRLKKVYDAQNQELRSLRMQLEEQVSASGRISTQRELLTARRDSLQALVYLYRGTEQQDTNRDDIRCGSPQSKAQGCQGLNGSSQRTCNNIEENKESIEKTKASIKSDPCGYIKQKEERYDAAKEDYIKTLNIIKCLLGNDNPATKTIHEMLKTVENKQEK